MDYLPLIPNKQLSKKYRKMQTKSSYTGIDTKLKNRIIQYLDTVDDQIAVCPDSIVNELRKTHSEYSRKKRSSFKLSVIKTYNSITNKKKSDSEDKKPETGHNDTTNRDASGISASDFSDDNENYVYFEDRNSVNNSIRDLYQKLTPKKVKPIQRNEEISVSKISNKTIESPVTKQEKEVESSSLENRVFNVSGKRNANNAPEPNDKGGSVPKRTKKKEVITQQSEVTFEDVGGNEKCLTEVCEMLVHLKHPEVYTQLGVQPPRGLLLHGPPGCGKTLLAHAIAGELQMPFIKVAATEIVTGVSGESEEKIRDLFRKAVSSSPCVLFIDEIDAITPKRETAQREMERRIVAQLLVCMDDLSSKDVMAQVLVIGATNRPDALDPALRRAGRFDREISMGIPDEAARIRILKVLCRKLKLEADFDFADIARNTPGYVGADLMALTRESAMCAVNRVFKALEAEKTSHEDAGVFNPATSVSLALSWLRDQPPLNEQQLKDLFVTIKDFKKALEFVQPSAKREGFATVPDVTWDDIGALKEVREELQLSILAPVRLPEEFKALGLSSSPGILLCGPPGCGKTLLAKAVANESGVNFISVKGPELLNMYVGESERAVRQCFQRARNSAPCVIFFDELDALCPKRSDSGEGSASSRVVNQLLTEMDGMDSRKDVYILGATNRPDIIDPAILRPGRLDKVLYVGLPMADDRFDILKTITKNATKPVYEDNVSLLDIAMDTRCSGFTGADLSSLVREASVAALKEFMTNSKRDKELKVGTRHFEAAFRTVRLSVSRKDQLMYEKMRRDFTKVVDDSMED